MIATKNNLNIANNKTMNSEYKELQNGKIQCNSCQSILAKSSWSRHIKTMKHIDGKVNKIGPRYSAMRAVTNGLRAQRIQDIGLEKVRE